MKKLPSGRGPTRLLAALASVPIAVAATMGILVGTTGPVPIVESGAQQASAPQVRSGQIVDPTFGTPKSYSVAEAIALDAIATTAETTLGTLFQLAERNQLTLPEADVSGGELKRLLRDGAIRVANIEKSLSVRDLQGRSAAPQSGALESIFDKIGPDNHFKSTRRLRVEDLQPGDVLVSSTREAISQLIKIATWGQFSHAALYVGDNQVIDATSKGVTQRSMQVFLSDASRVGVLRIRQATSQVRQQIVEHARKMLGRDYNYQGLGGMALNRMSCFLRNTLDAVRCLKSVASVPKAFAGNNSYFCSQLVDTALKRAGVRLFKQNGATPIDFVNLAVRGGSSAPITIVGHIR